VNREHFHKEISEIDFPKNEVFDAIERAIEKGRKETPQKRKSKLKVIGTISSVAASAFLTSGLIFAPITNVLAAVPLIGSIYEKFSLQIGNELLESNLITQLNKKAASNGVNLTITSAYYDGNVIGITFKAQGEKLSFDKQGDEGPVSGYNFHLFDGNEQKQWSSSMTQLEKTEDEYVAAIEFYNPKANLLKNYTLPITFSHIAGVNGNWKFDIPVKQIPSETINIQAKSILNNDKDYSLQMESIIKGKATTLLKYKTTFPLVGKNDEFYLTVYDDNGNELSKNSADVLSTHESNGVIVKDIRELFISKIKDNTKYLTIEPGIRKDEPDTIISLDNSTPFVVDSNRFDYKIQVNNIEQNGNQIILDYHIQNVNTKDIRKDNIQNFADFITLINSEDIQKVENGEYDIGKMLEYMIRSNQATKIKDGNLHFQSIFTIENTNGYNISDFSLMVPFGSLSMNEPIKMEPIKIDLNH
jgi:hypothetical protein